MSKSSNPSTPTKMAARPSRRPRSPSGSQAQSAENLEADNDSLRSVAAGPPADDAADESGNRALHSVATGPNPNVGRDDIERPARDGDREDSVEST